MLFVYQIVCVFVFSKSRARDDTLKETMENLEQERKLAVSEKQDIAIL